MNKKALPYHAKNDWLKVIIANMVDKLCTTQMKLGSEMASRDQCSKEIVFEMFKNEAGRLRLKEQYAAHQEEIKKLVRRKDAYKRGINKLMSYL